MTKAISRRRLVLAGLAAPAVVLGARLVRAAGDAAAGAIRAARPPSRGTTASRCAQCGAEDHAMLDRSCPMAPKVLG